MTEKKGGIVTQKEKETIKELIKTDNVKQFVSELRTFYLKYKAAMNETVTKLEILNEDFKTRYAHSPIDNIESRIKDPESLIKKMIRNDVSFDIKEVENKIFDIAGIRIICPFVKDIYDLSNMIQKNEEFTVLKIKDYIKNPKESGYRSYHMIVSLPVYLTTGKEEVIVEIQIRTMAMDFWASLEHKIKYKYDGIIPDSIKDELVECANTIAKADTQMMNISNKILDTNRGNAND